MSVDVNAVRIGSKIRRQVVECARVFMKSHTPRLIAEPEFWFALGELRGVIAMNPMLAELRVHCREFQTAAGPPDQPGFPLECSNALLDLYALVEQLDRML